jgi:hypothetical protein
MGYPSTHLKTYKRRLGLHERIHPTVLKEVRRICRKCGIEETQAVAEIVTEVLRRLRVGFRS